MATRPTPMEIVDEVPASEFQLDLSTPDYQARQVSRFSSMVLEATLGHLSPVTVTNNRLLDDEHSRVLGSERQKESQKRLFYVVTEGECFRQW